MEEKITVVGSELEQHAKQMRRYILSMINHAGSGHPGGSLSAVEVLAYLYQKELRFQPDNPDWTERDRFILSKGHACPVLYAAAVTCGIIDTDELGGFRKIGAALQGHPEFTKGYSAALMKMRQELLGEATYQRGMASLSEDTHEDVVGRWILNFVEGI